MAISFPAFLLGCVAATLIAAIFHYVKKGGLLKLLLFIFLANLGFWVGHWLGEMWQISLGAVGPLNMGLALLITLGTLYIGNWLTDVNTK